MEYRKQNEFWKSIACHIQIALPLEAAEWMDEEAPPSSVPPLGGCEGGGTETSFKGAPSVVPVEGGPPSVVPCIFWKEEKKCQWCGDSTGFCCFVWGGCTSVSGKHPNSWKRCIFAVHLFAKWTGEAVFWKKIMTIYVSFRLLHPVLHWKVFLKSRLRMVKIYHPPFSVLHCIHPSFTLESPFFLPLFSTWNLTSSSVHIQSVGALTKQLAEQRIHQRVLEDELAKKVSKEHSSHNGNTYPVLSQLVTNLIIYLRTRSCKDSS